MRPGFVLEGRMLTVRDNGRAFDAQLARDLGRDLPFAIARGITWTLKDVQANHPKWARKAFDDPVQWTLRAMAIRPATKTRPGMVFYKSQARSGGKGVPAGKYLLPNIRGGGRVHTRWERSLIAKGIMNRGEYAMPTPWSIGRNGNVMTRLYAEIIAQLRIGNAGIGNATASMMARRRKRNVERIFVSHKADGGIPRGIWQRDWESGEITPLFIFTTKRPRYRVIFPWKVWARKTVEARLPVQIRRSARAITAKRNR